MAAPYWFLPYDNQGPDAGPPSRRFERSERASDNETVSDNDALLVARIRASDDDAFAQLFHTYYKDLHRYATSLTRNAAIAEELVADMFVALWDRRDGWAIRDSVRAYLFTAVRHRVLHWHRRMRLEARYAADRAEFPEMDMTIEVAPDDAAAWNEVVRLIRSAIAALPPRTREAYVLHRQDELTYGEVARIMGTSAKTVEKQVGAALRALRMALSHMRES